MELRARIGMLTTTRAARMLHLHANTVRRWSDKGILKSYRIGPRADRRFAFRDIVDFLNQGVKKAHPR